MSSEKEEMTFGHEVTLIIVWGFVLAVLITYVHQLAEPHLESACGTSQVQVDLSRP